MYVVLATIDSESSDDDVGTSEVSQRAKLVITSPDPRVEKLMMTQCMRSCSSSTLGYKISRVVVPTHGCNRAVALDDLLSVPEQRRSTRLRLHKSISCAVQLQVMT